MENSPIAKVGDFGLAQVLSPFIEKALETWGWMAPEALEGRPYTEKADIYSLGIVLWELVNGRYFRSVTTHSSIRGEPPFQEYVRPPYTTVIKMPVPAKQWMNPTEKAKIMKEGEWAVAREEIVDGQSFVHLEKHLLNVIRLKEAIISSMISLRPTFPQILPKASLFLANLAKECWVHNPKERPSATDILQRVELFANSMGIHYTPPKARDPTIGSLQIHRCNPELTLGKEESDISAVLPKIHASASHILLSNQS